MKANYDEILNNFIALFIKFSASDRLITGVVELNSVANNQRKTQTYTAIIYSDHSIAYSNTIYERAT